MKVPGSRLLHPLARKASALGLAMTLSFIHHCLLLALGFELSALKAMTDKKKVCFQL